MLNYYYFIPVESLGIRAVNCGKAQASSLALYSMAQTLSVGRQRGAHKAGVVRVLRGHLFSERPLRLRRARQPLDRDVGQPKGAARRESKHEVYEARRAVHRHLLGVDLGVSMPPRRPHFSNRRFVLPYKVRVGALPRA